MRKLMAILMLACLAAGRSAAHEWTDANGVKWLFDQRDFTINGETQRLWYVYGSSNYGEEAVVPQTVYKGSEACTIEAIGNQSYQYLNFSGTSLTLPPTIKYVYTSRFAGILTVEAPAPPLLRGDNVTACLNVLVPGGSLDAYRTADGWKDVAQRIISLDATTDYDVTTTAEHSASGIHQAIGEDNLDVVMSLKLRGTINSYDIIIMRNRMPNLHFLDLTEATVKASTYEYYTRCHTEDDVLGDNAFCNLSNLISVKLPKTIARLGSNAFAGCANLKRIESHEGLREIGDKAFKDCKSLADVRLKDGVESMGADCFNRCTALTEIIMPEGLTMVPADAFYSCENLARVVLPSTIEGIADGFWGSFGYCRKLTDVNLPQGMRTIGKRAFYGCSALCEIRLPSSIRTIGEESFNGCNSLSDIYVSAVEPTPIGQNTFSTWTTATLHIPELGYYNYYWDTQWSQFASLQTDHDYTYEYFYIARDLNIDDKKIGMVSTPSADLLAGAGLTVSTTEATLQLDRVSMACNKTTAASIIAHGNLTVGHLDMEMEMDANKWYFLSVPFRVKRSSITAPGAFALRYYDGEERATSGRGGWKDYTGSYLLPGQGYIVETNASGKLRLPVAKDDTDFGDGERTVALTAYAAADKHDASWNYVGNPHTAYYDIGLMGFEAPITVWNGSNYVAVRPGDDRYHLAPLQGFFVQKPEDADRIAFPATGRHTYQQWEEEGSSHARTATTGAAQGPQHTRTLTDLTISTGGEQTDRTRVVFNDDKSTDYELDCDAAKFFAGSSPQIYTTDGHNRYAINERPQGEVRIGYTTGSEAVLTIEATRTDLPVLLRDRLTGTAHNLHDGGYTFLSEAGTFEDRIVLTIATETAAIDERNVTREERADIFSLTGLRTDGQPRAGIYVVNRNGRPTKMVVK